MTNLLTDIPGHPADFTTAEHYLRKNLAGGAGTLANNVHSEKSQLNGLFEGDSATAFRDRSNNLVSAADTYETETKWSV
ncbi:MAG: hypothetical protein FWE71_04260 [Nocardioidaceae bacterium]|nr:hypothetical protein [Nocardioidaceae bacterium]MCL2612977.1 hypothetical protein [Nocardioidaceae bacterium]